MSTTIATDEVDILDVTDGFSVILTSEAHTFPGSTSAAIAGSTTTQIIAMRGKTQVAASVDLTAITAPTGITITKDTDATEPTLTIAIAATVTTGGTLTIPVYIASGDVTINKTFSYSIAFKGTTGATGSAGTNGTNGTNGKDAVTLKVTSSAGYIFKNTDAVTTLTAHVYKGATELSSSTTPTLASMGTISWYKDGGTTAVATGATLSISSGTVTDKATYVAKLEA